jgi:glyoxylase-like metal-dependent hydrolase (beta-lactamase superfamily II)
MAMHLVVGGDGALLVDTGIAGSVAEFVAPKLTELGLPPDALAEVVLTHADVDHYGGDGEVRELAPGARLRAHPLDLPLIESWERIAGERYGWYRKHGLDYPEDTWHWLEEAAGPDTALDGTVVEGEAIALGGGELEVLELPGHSLGHLGLWIAGQRTAIVGDAVMGYGFHDLEGVRVAPPPYQDLEAYRATIARVRLLAPRRLLTTHFPVMEGEAVGAFLDLSRRFTDDLERVLGDGGSVGEALARAAGALGGYPEMELELARSIGAHLEARGS